MQKEQQGLLLLPGILLNLHPPTEATTPPSENTRPWVRGNPNGEARNDVPGTTHPPKRYHTPARVDIIPDKPVWPGASLRFSKSQFRPIFGHFGQFWARRLTEVQIIKMAISAEIVMGPT
ncbi:hypothetical protein BS47DRAFT_1368241 [Hydnum rufescens UP504]|uniref:Uncharacterized protein n=1 Tax=Hydnum rufescens UP504 TaxID=1448309 RepID=A0A9P6DKL6_9AGAM|nr:hypothetical protein BS47DRAFT_1368241 [Hydnum rufescens UP504]